MKAQTSKNTVLPLAMKLRKLKFAIIPESYFRKGNEFMVKPTVISGSLTYIMQIFTLCIQNKKPQNTILRFRCYSSSDYDWQPQEQATFDW